MEATLTSNLTPLVGNLRSLHVHWNSCVTDEFLSWAVQSIPRLEVRTMELRAGFTLQNKETGCWCQMSRFMVVAVLTAPERVRDVEGWAAYSDFCFQGRSLSSCSPCVLALFLQHLFWLNVGSPGQGECSPTTAGTLLLISHRMLWRSCRGFFSGTTDVPRKPESDIGEAQQYAPMLR